MLKISVLGVGAFGFALLRYLDQKNDGSYRLYAYDVSNKFMKDLKKSMKRGIIKKEKISRDVKPVNSYEELIKGADIIILAVRSDATRYVINGIKPYIKKDAIILNVAKALDHETGKPLSYLFDKYLPKANYAVLAGGMIASDVLLSHPLGADIASKDSETLKTLEKVLSYPSFHIYSSKDVEGVQYASSFKNLVSLFTGIIKGLGYTFGTETFFITRISKEVEEILENEYKLKSTTLTMHSQCWGNDVWMSSLGNTRNRKFGIEIGKIGSAKEAIDKMERKRYSIESLNTLRAISPLITKHARKYPILSVLNQIVLYDTSPKNAIKNLLAKNL